MTPILLEVKDLSVGYQRPLKANIVVSSGIDLMIGPGEFVCLLGPNGAGKSTLLRTLAGEQLPLAGTVRLDGRDVHAIAKTELSRLVSVVLTEKITSSLITVFDLVAMGRIPYTNWLGTLGAEDRNIVEDSLLLAGAHDLRDRRLSDLSDGERQRCMLARALAQRPKLLVLDEITAFLDLPRRIEMMHRLQQLAHETQVAILLSTHDLDLALATADRILLQPKSKTLVDAGPEDLVLSGAFESAFESEGLIFDKLSGSFSRARTLRGTVDVEARGVEGYWAQRALERTGFSCRDESSEARATVRRTEQGTWELRSTNLRQDFQTLSSLVSALLKETTDSH